MTDITGQIMTVIVMVSINGQRFCLTTAKQCQVGRVIADVFRLAMAADVLVQANNFIGCGHHQMQIV